MSSRAQHYREAERLSESEDPTWANTPTPWSPRPRSAPPWPPSATTPTTSTWTLRSLEETREEVAGTPSPKSRDWLTDDDESAAQDASVERLPCLRGAEERAAKVRAARARAPR